MTDPTAPAPAPAAPEQTRGLEHSKHKEVEKRPSVRTPPVQFKRTGQEFAAVGQSAELLGEAGPSVVQMAEGGYEPAAAMAQSGELGEATVSPTQATGLTEEDRNKGIAAEREERRKLVEETNRLREQAKALQDSLPELRRVAFAANDVRRLRQLSEVADALEDSRQDLVKVSRIIGALGSPWAKAQAVALDAIRPAVDALRVAVRLTDTAEATQVDELMRGISNGVEVGSIAGSRIPILNSYLKLMSALIVHVSKHFARIREELHDDNVDHEKLFPGEDLPYGGAEPPKAVRDYVVVVMTRKSVESIPKPPESVADYFFDHRERLAEATGEPVPIEGVIGFRRIGSDFPTWIHDNRGVVWDCLFGSIPRPSTRKHSGTRTTKERE